MKRAILAAFALTTTAACRQAPPPATAIFTPARPTVAQAAREFFGIVPAPRQPLPFPHKRHIE